MTKLEFLALAARLFGDAHELLETKNEDYSVGEAFDHFDKLSKIAEIIGLDVTKRHHDPLYRIIAKILRLRSLEHQKPKHESVRDSCMDGINFFIIYYGMLREGQDDD